MNKVMNIIPLPDPRLVPRHLLEQIKDRMFDIDDWYKVMYSPRLEGDSSNIFLGIVDEDMKIHGATWLSLDALHKAIFINFLSLDKSLQGNGKVFDVVIPYIAEIAEGLGLERALWMS